MRQFFNEIVVQMRGIWGRLESQQRLVVSAVLLATAVGLGAMVWYAGQPSYEVVFTSASSDDLTKASQALNSANVTFIPNGNSLTVERSDKGRAQSAINQAGITGSTGSNGLAPSSMLEDAKTKQFRLDNASRNMAQAAISKLDGVIEVSVASSKPRRLIAYRNGGNSEKASATVLLRLQSGVQFTAIAHNAASIAASQLMIPIENIDVVSAVGGQRWRFNPDREGGGGSSEFLEMQRNISDARTRIAQDRLDQLYPGKISVQVQVDLDPKWEVRSEKIVPPEPLVKSEDTTKDATDGAEDAGTSKNEKKTKEYITEIGERRTGSMMPEIRRLSVAVLYDESLKKAGFEDELKGVIKAIVGWDEARDDEKSFSTMSGPFAPPAAPVEISTGPGVAEMVTQWAPMVGQVLGVVVVVMFLRGLFKKSRKPAVAEEEFEPEIPEEDLAPEEQQKRMRREIERSIANDPAAIAKMLEAWLLEQRA